MDTALDVIVCNIWFKKRDRTWWWNKDEDQAIKQKKQLWKEWKKGACKEPYLKAKKDSKRAVYGEFT